MLTLFIYLLILVIVGGLIFWLIDFLPIPQPFNKVAKVILIIIFILFLVLILLGFTGGGPDWGFHYRH